MPERLLDQNLLWQQFDGPQAKAIMEGGRSWFKSWAVPSIRYFRAWGLETAKGRHLDFIGNIMGVSRPIVIADFYIDQAFKFWNPPPGLNNPTGFGNAPAEIKDPDDTSPADNGGVFDYLNDNDRPSQTLTDMTDNEYRFLLQTLASSQGELGSYLFVDDICKAYTGANYELQSAYGQYADARPEDLLIYITSYIPRAFLAIEAVMRNYVTPFPRVYVNMAGGS